MISAIAEHLPVGVWVARVPDGAFVYANRAFADIMGMGPEPAVQAGEYAPAYGIFDREGEPYREERLPFVRAMTARASVVVDDLVIHRRDGRRVYVRAFARPITDESGAILQIAIAFVDITDEVRAGTREREVQERLNSVLAQAPLVIFAFDCAGIVSLSEGRGLERMGLAPRELVGRSVFEVYRDREDVLDNCKRALAGESFVITNTLGAGVFESTLGPQRDEHGAIVGVVGISLDITERTEMNRRLVEVERLAAMGTLAATVAHEINNPLTYVLANLEVLGKRLDKLGPVAQDHRALVSDIREGADRVRRIVRDLKGFSRDDDRAEPTDVVTVLERAIVLSEGELRQRACLVRDYRPVPRVLANEARLGQVFVNLLVNAAHAIAEGSADVQQIRLRVFEDQKTCSVVVEIEDTGAGMSSETRQRIFDPFFTTKNAGSGLGLCISRQIIQRFAGEITVESTEGRGSTFRVQLPATDLVICSARPIEAVSRRLRVLVIDDDERVATAVERLLGTDHEVATEIDARRALGRLLAGESYDVVLCDVMMPTLSGVELHRVLSEAAPDQADRIVFVTGGAFSDATRDFLATVGNVCIEKPFDPRQLADVLRAR